MDRTVAFYIMRTLMFASRKLAEKFPDLSSPNQPEDNPNATGSGFSFQLISF